MNRFRLHLLTALVGILSLTLVTAAVAADQVPFKGNLSLLNVPASNNEGCPAGTIRFNVTGGGYVTHMGAVTLLETVCFNPVDGTFTAQFTLTAGNGDTVSATAAGYTVPTSQITFIVHGQWSVTGGTGRFTGATGSGSAIGPINLATGEGTHHLDGTISSVGSD